MTTVRITKLERHEGGFYTANVTADNSDTVRVDNATGPWSFPLDPSMPANARCARRMVLGWCVALLNKRVDAFERGESPDERAAHAAPKPDSRNFIHPAGSRAGRAERRAAERRTTTPDQIATAMAKAASAAVKEAA